LNHKLESGKKKKKKLITPFWDHSLNKANKGKGKQRPCVRRILVCQTHTHNEKETIGGRGA
jgi:hypothetical protein